MPSLYRIDNLSSSGALQRLSSTHAHAPLHLAWVAVLAPVVCAPSACAGYPRVDSSAIVIFFVLLHKDYQAVTCALCSLALAYESVVVSADVLRYFVHVFFGVDTDIGEPITAFVVSKIELLVDERHAVSGEPIIDVPVLVSPLSSIGPNFRLAHAYMNGISPS